MLLELESSSLALAWVVDYLRALRRGRLRPYCFCERKARAATRGSVAWGPTGEQLRELAAASYESANLAPIFAVLSARLRANPEAQGGHAWRKTYKALVTLEWLATRGSPAAAARANGMRFLLEELRAYRCVDAQTGNDNGVNIRHRSAAILALLSDSEQLATLREAQTKTYWAVSSSALPARPTYDDLGRGRGGSSSPPRPRAAGDSKGLSAEVASRARAVLERAARRAPNRACADCGDAPAGWASVSCGVFLCQQCAGVHRGLGVHLSVVRSLSLDAWSPAQADFMAAAGNDVANAHWEALLPPTFRRPSSQQQDGRRPPELEAFIRRKYGGAFARPGAAWPPQAGAAAAEARPPPPLLPQAQMRAQVPPPLPPRKPLPALPEAGPAPASVAPMISFFDEEDDALVLGAPPPLPPPQRLPLPSFFADDASEVTSSPLSEAAPPSFFGPPRAAPPSLAAVSVALPDSVAAMLTPPPAARLHEQPPDGASRSLVAQLPPVLPPRASAVAASPQLMGAADPFAMLAPVAVMPAAAPPATPLRPQLGASAAAPRDVFADLGVL